MIMASNAKLGKSRPDPGAVRHRISEFMSNLYQERLRNRQVKPLHLTLEEATKREKAKVSFSSRALPKKIKIRRERGYHTHYVGKCKDGTQFMAFVVATKPATGRRTPRWYAVVHHFDSNGKHLATESKFLGCKEFAKDLSNPDVKLATLLRNLGPRIYGDISVRLFKVRIDGETFGLVDESIPIKGYQRIDLVPHGLAFFPPWDGTYDT